MLCQNQLLRKGTKITTGKNYDYHSVKNVRILSFSGLNGGKYGPEKLQIWTLFTQCIFKQKYDIGAKLMRLNYTKMFYGKKISLVTTIKVLAST